jgi:hemolysin-activating ACP:hemolysin acyltransferase
MQDEKLASVNAQAEDGLARSSVRVSDRDVDTVRAMMAVQASVGEAVMLLARDPDWRHTSLADLEWLLLPAISANQFMTIRSKVQAKDSEVGNITIPMGMALWALVSDEVEQKLLSQKEAGTQPRLAPQDWTSGDIPWLMLVTGPEAVREALVSKVREKLGQDLKMFASSNGVDTKGR